MYAQHTCMYTYTILSSYISIVDFLNEVRYDEMSITMHRHLPQVATFHALLQHAYTVFDWMTG